MSLKQRKTNKGKRKKMHSGRIDSVLTAITEKLIRKWTEEFPSINRRKT